MKRIAIIFLLSLLFTTTINGVLRPPRAAFFKSQSTQSDTCASDVGRYFMVFDKAKDNCTIVTGDLLIAGIYTKTINSDSLIITPNAYIMNDEGYVIPDSCRRTVVAIPVNDSTVTTDTISLYPLGTVLYPQVWEQFYFENYKTYKL
ncbi:MAG: hypothetical protein K2M00_05645 [Muribaculaceae bacterium]|nr:hypothetical protein [Muribaculaceae bacterium]